MNLHTENRKKTERASAESENEVTYGGMRCRLTLDEYEGKKKARTMNSETKKTIGVVLLFAVVVITVSVGIIIAGIFLMKNAENRAESRNPEALTEPSGEIPAITENAAQYQ